MDALTDAERALLISELVRRPQLQLDDFTAEAREVSPACGDEITVRVRVVPTGIQATGGLRAQGSPAHITEIQAIGISGHGCAVSMAAAAALADLAPVQLPEFPELFARYCASVAAGGDPVQRGELEAFAGIGRFPLRARCATLAWVALQSALQESQHDRLRPAR